MSRRSSTQDAVNVGNRIVRVIPPPHMGMETGIRPIHDRPHKAMLRRIPIDVIDMPTGDIS